MSVVVARKAHLIIPVGLEKQEGGDVVDIANRMREPLEILNAVGYAPWRAADTAVLADINKVRKKHACCGYRRTHAEIIDGVKGVLNHKRVHRLWRENGLQHPTRKKRKRGRKGNVPLQWAPQHRRYGKSKTLLASFAVRDSRLPLHRGEGCPRLVLTALTTVGIVKRNRLAVVAGGPI